MRTQYLLSTHVLDTRYFVLECILFFGVATNNQRSISAISRVVATAGPEAGVSVSVTR